MYAWIPFLLAVLPFLYTLFNQFHSLCLMPLQMKRKLDAQGIPGMPFRFLYGNSPDMVALIKTARSSPLPQLSHDIAPRIIPYYFIWSQKLGKPFYFWFDSRPRLIVAEPEQAREIFANKFGHFGKQRRRPDAKDLLGDGLGSLNGEKWAQHRRIVGHAFFMEKLKDMIPKFAALTTSMLEKWELDSGKKEIDVHGEFRTLTADIIAHTAFGSSYAEGKRVFEIQQEQLTILNKNLSNVYIPGSRFLPTATNRHGWKINNELQNLLRQLIYSRMEGKDCQNDLLGIMIAANKRELKGNQKNLSLSVSEIVDECRTFFFGGHEPTSTLLTWTMLLLGCDMEWQEKAREEVLAICGRSNPPTRDSLNHLKVVGMVLNEVLRLYPPASVMVRQATKDTRLGDRKGGVIVPRGATFLVPIIAFHHDPQYWGDDAHQFNPDRFVRGVAAACKPSHAFLPFGIGPRTCVGQSFAILEAKVVLALILQHFRFHVSPSYTHSPTTAPILKPQFGMPIMFERFT